LSSSTSVRMWAALAVKAGESGSSLDFSWGILFDFV
jgi:hypothetical protein